MCTLMWVFWTDITMVGAVSPAPCLWAIRAVRQTLRSDLARHVAGAQAAWDSPRVPAPQRETVTAHGLTFNITVHRPQAARTVLLLHGYLDQGRSMDALAEALPEDTRCLALDWRGHGRSSRAGAGGSYHIQDHARDLDALWDVLGLESPWVVGHSMGGNVALLVLGSGARRARGLVLLDTLGPPDEPATEAADRMKSALQARRARREPRVMAGVEQARARLLETNPGLTETGAARLLVDAVVAVDGGVRWAWEPAVQGTPLFRYTPQAWLSFLGGVACPTLLVRGDHGILAGRDVDASRYDAVKALSVVTLENTGHHLHVDAPEAIAAAVVAWMSSLG